MKDGTAWVTVEGSLAGPWVDECRSACAPEATRGRPFALDLTELRFADAAGVEFLREMAHAGRIQRRSTFVAELLRSEETAMTRQSIGERTRDTRTACADREDARKELVRRHGGALLAVTRRLLRSESEAIAALQDSFRLAFDTADSCPSDARTWLHSIAIDVCLARLRTTSESSADPADLLPVFDEDGRHARRIAPWQRGPDAPELGDTVRRCFDELPDPYRIVMLLCDVEGLAPREAARRLRIPPKVAAERLHRARQALRSLLEPSFVASA